MAILIFLNHTLLGRIYQKEIINQFSCQDISMENDREGKMRIGKKRIEIKWHEKWREKIE